MSDEQIDKKLSITDAALFKIGEELQQVCDFIEPADRSCAWEIRQTISALSRARLRVKQSIEKPVLPTSKEVRAIFKKSQ